MRRSSGLFSFFIFVFLVAIVLLQVTYIKQSKRIGERIEYVLDVLSSSGSGAAADKRSSLSGVREDEYPGDEGDWLIWRLDAEPATLNPVSTLSSVYTVWIFLLMRR